MNLESSTISRSVSKSSAATSATEGLLAKKSYVYMFALFDQLTQHVTIPSLFYFITCFWFTIQTIYTSMWVCLGSAWRSTNIGRSFERWLMMISMLQSDSETLSAYGICFAVYTAVILVLILFVAYAILWYRERRRFNRASLYPIRFLMELATMVLAHPVGLLFARSFLQVVNGNHNALMVVIMIVTLVECVFILAVMHVMNIFNNSSPYITSTSVMCSFSYTPVDLVTISSPTLLAVGWFISYFPDWMGLVVCAIHFVIMLAILILTTQRPFMHQASNILFFAVMLASLLMDLTAIVCSFFKTVHGVLLIFLLALYYVVSTIVAVVFFHVQGKKMHANLTFTDESYHYIENQDGTIKYYAAPEIDKMARYRDLGLDRSAFKAMRYLHFAVAHYEPANFDLSLVKFIVQAHKSANVLANCIMIVSYFPANSRLLNVMIGDIVTKRDLSFANQFLLYQLARVKILRQSSSSAVSNDRLKEMKLLTQDIEALISSFWSGNTNGLGYLANLSSLVNKSNALWIEALQEFPNSSQHYEAYARFLIECATDFQEAVLKKHRCDLIEQGRSFSVDTCFRRFIHTFPDYLKKGIVDTKGEVIIEMKRRQGDAMSSVGSPRAMSSQASQGSLSTLDVTMEETIAKGIMSHARMRLALQNATDGKKANWSRRFRVFGALCLLFTIVCAFAIFFTFFAEFDERDHIANRLELSNSVRLHYYSSYFANFINWGLSTGTVNLSVLSGAYEALSSAVLEPYMNVLNDWGVNAEIQNNQSRDSYNEYLVDIASLASAGTDVYTLTGPLLSETVGFTYCHKGVPISPPSYVNLKTALSYLYVQTSLVTSDKNYSGYFTDSDFWCATTKAQEDLYVSFQVMRDAMTAGSTSAYNSAANVINYFCYILPPVFFVLTVIPFIIITVRLLKEIRYFEWLLTDLDQSVKQESSNPISTLVQSQVNSSSKTSSHMSSDVNTAGVLIALISILMVGLTVMFFCHVYFVVREYNNRFEWINQWITNARVRKSLVMEIMTEAALVLVLSNSSLTPTEMTTIEAQVELITGDILRIQEATMVVSQESEGLPSPLGFSEEIDRYTMQELCVPKHNDTSLHGRYSCSSADQLLNLFVNMISELLALRDTFGGKLVDELPLHALHCANSHLVPIYMIIDGLYGDLSVSFLTNFKIIHSVLFAAEIVIGIILLSLIISFIRYCDSCYNAVLILLRRVPPVSIVSKQALIDFVLDKSTIKSSQVRSTAYAIIHNSLDSIMFLDVNGVVESVNASLTQLLGFTPEQLLGQPFGSIFAEDDRNKIATQLTLMKNKQSSLVYEDHIICVSDDDTNVQCSAIVLAMANEHHHVKGFVVILCDETQLMQQQKEAEFAKRQSEELLYNILPRDIVMRINQGEKDISFSVPSATVMFIDIVKFSAFAADLTPQEIMGTLSSLFNGYDQAIQNYPLMTKIKLIGDVYMCAAGLFTPDEPPVHHAEQTVRMGLDALQVLEENNMKMNAALNVRIGVNTGGPLIAGVLGTDKPVFDIIGDTINVASRLQSTDIPGHIQISQETYSLVNDLDFQIEARGEIFLKGKGKTFAYLVMPRSYNFQLTVSQPGQESLTTTSPHSLANV